MTAAGLRLQNLLEELLEVKAFVGRRRARVTDLGRPWSGKSGQLSQPPWHSADVPYSP